MIIIEATEQNKSIETVKQAESRKNEFEKIRESISFDTTELQKKFYTLFYSF